MELDDQEECYEQGICLHNHTRDNGNLPCPECRAPEYFPCSIDCIMKRCPWLKDDMEYVLDVRWDAHYALSKRV